MGFIRYPSMLFALCAYDGGSKITELVLVVINILTTSMPVPNW